MRVVKSRMTRSRWAVGPFAVDDMIQLVNPLIQWFHVLSPLILGLNPESQVDFKGYYA